ncbi:MAG: flagellar biosynthesis regulator FlaF [Devosia sp.]
MQAETYVAMSEQSSSLSREREREAFDQGIALLEAAQSAPLGANVRLEATRYMQTLWGFLIRDLTDPRNDLSPELKANLVSIGLWIMKETDAIVAGQRENWAGLIEINRTVREGLKQ